MLIVAVEETAVDDEDGTSNTGAGVRVGGSGFVCVSKLINDSDFTFDDFAALHLCRIKLAVPVVFL